MKRGRKLLIAGVTVAALGVGGVGLAQAVGGDSEEQVTGPEADRAKAAAVQSVGGGRAVGAERDDDDGGAWEVEVIKRDGGKAEVGLTRELKRASVEADDDGAERDDEGAERDDGGKDED